MEITRVRITKADSNNTRLLAYADVNIDDIIAIHGIKIIKGDNKNFIAFPSTKRVNQENTGFV